MCVMCMTQSGVRPMYTWKLHACAARMHAKDPCVQGARVQRANATRISGSLLGVANQNRDHVLAQEQAHDTMHWCEVSLFGTALVNPAALTKACHIIQCCPSLPSVAKEALRMHLGFTAAA